MKRIYSIFLGLIFSTVLIGQTVSVNAKDSIFNAERKQLIAEVNTLDYDALSRKIIKDLPLTNFKDAPTFLRTTYDEVGDVFPNYKTTNFPQSFTHQKFFSSVHILQIQKKIKTILIPYTEVNGMEHITLFLGDPILKIYPLRIPNFENIVEAEMIINNVKTPFYYLSYDGKKIENPIVIKEKNPVTYIEKTNNIRLQFKNYIDKKVTVSGDINHQKVFLEYEEKNGTWKLINSQITSLERENADYYTLFKEQFTSIYEHQNNYYRVGEKFELYRRKIRTLVTKDQFPRKQFNLKNVAEISKYDFDELQHKKFIAYKGNYKYELYQFNKEFFILEIFYDSSEGKIEKDWTYSSSEILPFTFIELKDKKKILTLLSSTHQNYIVPKKDSLELKIWARYQAKNIILLNFTETEIFKPKYDSKTLQRIASQLFQLEKYYQIISEKGKKRLYNYRGEDVLKKSYDSIVLNNFIIGFKQNKYDVYNQTFKKLKLPKLQAVHLDRKDRFNLQVIQNNELKSIPLSNDTSEKNYVTNYPAPFMPQLKAEIAQKIEERDNEFRFIREFTFDTLTIPKSGIKDIYFLQNNKKEIVTDHYAYVITELTNGSFNLFDLRKPNINLLEQVDEISQIANCIRFKKDNLYGYYGMHTKGRYKKLDQFQGFYARFELPNGKQGWLDRNGKEYLNL